MTRQKSFKRLVRARMAKTGESYTAARAMLLSPDQEPGAGGTKPALATSDDKIRARTGRGWEEWFDLLDEWGALERSHREIARWIADQLDIAPLAWNAQAIADTYERARGLRVTGQHADGFRASVTRTIAVPVAQLYESFVDPALRQAWLPEGPLRERTASAPTSARFDWGDGPGRLHVTFTPKGDGKAAITVSHIRLADATEADEARQRWRERLTTLKALLEGGGLHD